jgi:hypothetical protein
MLKSRFFKRKNKPIRIFNKKKSKIINLSNKILINKFIFFNKNKYFFNSNFYFFDKKKINLFNFNILNNFFNYKLHLDYNFQYFNSFTNYRSLLIINIISNIKFNIRNNYNVTNNFLFLFLFYLNNSTFNIKNNYIWYLTFYEKNIKISSILNKTNLTIFNKNRYLIKEQNFFYKFKNKLKTNHLNLINFKFFFNMFIFKKNLNSNFKFSFFYFKNFYNKKKLFKYNNTFFKLLKNDWVNNLLARLTKYCFKLNYSELYSFKNLNTNKNNFLKLLNFFLVSDPILENNYFFLSLNKNNNKYNFKNFYYWTMLKLINSKKLNKNVYFNFFNKNKFYSISCNYNYNKLYNNFKIDNLFLSKNNKLEILFFFYFNNIFFKYKSDKLSYSNLYLNNKCFRNVINFLSDSFFYSSNNYFFFNNIAPNPNFNYILKKKILKIFSYTKFSVTTTLWQYNAVIRFLEFCSGRKVCLKFFNFLNNTLNFKEKAQCRIWAQKLKYFRKVLGPKLFLNESLQVMYLSLKLKDPYFLSNWMVHTMYKISFWKYKMFLRYLKFILRYFFWVIFKELKIKGIKFQLKGKISVAGNARTRTIFHNVGFTSHGTFDNKILYNLSLVRSFTGVMGLKTWIVF